MTREADGPGQALARRDNELVITTRDQYVACAEDWAHEHYHVLSPFVNFGGLAPGFVLVPTKVLIDSDPDHNEVYVDDLFCKNGEVAIAKIGLSKIQQCAAMTVKTDWLSLGAVMNYWACKAVARWRGIDGSIIERDATEELDLRDGSARSRSFKPTQLMMARAKGAANCETRAINRGIRGYGVRQKYTRAELERPFVVLAVVFQPDLSNADTRARYETNALAGTSELYTHARPRLTGAHIIDITPDPATPAAPPHAAAASSTSTSSPATPLTSPAQPSLPEGAVFIVKLETRTLKRKKDQSPFTKWIAVDSHGVEHVTIDRKFGESLERCHAQKTPVELVSEENNYQENELQEISPIDTRQPSLPADGIAGQRGFKL